MFARIVLMAFLSLVPRDGTTSVVDLVPTVGWEQRLESMPDGATVRLRPDNYVMRRTVRLEHMRNIRIVGAGRNRTRIILPADLPVGFEIVGDLTEVSIESLGIVGSLRSHAQADAAAGAGGTAPPGTTRGTHAIASFSSAYDVEGMSLIGLGIKDVPAGIGIAGDWRRTLVADCRISDCWGTTSGRGYGIVASDATELSIVGNSIARCGRHGIYVGGGPGPVWVESNTIIDHRIGELIGDFFRPALVIARSSNVIARNNRIVRSADAGLSVEADNQPPIQRVTGIQLIGNTFEESRPGVPDIWINAGDDSDPIVLHDNDLGGRKLAEAVRIDTGSIVRKED